MEFIIAKIYKILKETENLIEFEERIQQLMYETFTGLVGDVFNHFLSKWNTTFEETGKGLTYNACSKELPVLKIEEATIWLKEVDSIALQSSIRYLADSYDRFFKKQNKAPRFKSKNNPVQAYTTKYTNDNIIVSGNKIKLPKLG